MRTTNPLAATQEVGSVTIVPAKPGDLSAILQVVRTVHLPTDGIGAALPYFWVARGAERMMTDGSAPAYILSEERHEA